MHDGKSTIPPALRKALPETTDLGTITLTAEQVALLASRHGHDYQRALAGVRQRPRAWAEQVRKWLEADAAQARETSKHARDQRWAPNSTQLRVLAFIAEHRRMSASADVPMFPQYRPSTRALIRRGWLRRTVDAVTGVIEYEVLAPGTMTKLEDVGFA